MNFVKMFKSLVTKKSASEAAEVRTLVIMQRIAKRFTEEELRDAAERGWGKKFDGTEDPMYFISADHPALTVVKAGKHIIKLTSFPCRYNDDDEYALSQLPKPEQKKAWSEHHAFALLEFFNDLSSRDFADAEVYASLAKLALQLDDPNCTAIFVPIKNLMMPNDGTAATGLQMMINKELPLDF